MASILNDLSAAAFAAPASPLPLLTSQRAPPPGLSLYQWGRAPLHVLCCEQGLSSGCRGQTCLLSKVAGPAGHDQILPLFLSGWTTCAAHSCLSNSFQLSGHACGLWQAESGSRTGPISAHSLSYSLFWGDGITQTGLFTW